MQLGNWKKAERLGGYSMRRVGVGIDLNTRALNGKSIKYVDEYIRGLREHRVINVDLIVNYVLDDNNRYIIDAIHNNGLSVSLHSNGINDIYTTFHSSKDVNSSIELQLNALNKANDILRGIGFEGGIPVVYHGGEVVNKDRKIDIQLAAEFFEELSRKAYVLDMEILTESLSLNHPKVDCIGNNWIDLQELNRNISSKNWGICWDTGHTRGNAEEEGKMTFPPINILDKIKFTHIHHMGEDSVDHLPIISGEWQDNEVKFLILSNYKGIFSLEYDFRLVDEENHAELIYLSTYRLAAMIDYFYRNSKDIVLLDNIRRSNLRVDKKRPMKVIRKGKVLDEIDYQISIDSIMFKKSDIRDYNQIIIDDGYVLNVEYLGSRDGMAIYKIQNNIYNLDEYRRIIDFIFDMKWASSAEYNSMNI